MHRSPTKPLVSMARLLLLSILLLPILLRAVPAEAQQVTGGEIQRFGLYEVVLSGELVSQGSQDAYDVNRLTSFELIEATDRVPIQDGVTFGFDWIPQGSPDGAEIQITLLLVRPDGSTSRGADITEVGANQHTSLTIHNPDMAEGWYTLAVHYQGRLLASKKFDLYRP